MRAIAALWADRGVRASLDGTSHEDLRRHGDLDAVAHLVTAAPLHHRRLGIHPLEATEVLDGAVAWISSQELTVRVGDTEVARCPLPQLPVDWLDALWDRGGLRLALSPVSDAGEVAERLDEIVAASPTGWVPVTHAFSRPWARPAWDIEHRRWKSLALHAQEPMTNPAAIAFDQCRLADLLQGGYLDAAMLDTSISSVYDEDGTVHMERCDRVRQGERTAQSTTVSLRTALERPCPVCGWGGQMLVTALPEFGPGRTLRRLAQLAHEAGYAVRNEPVAHARSLLSALQAEARVRDLIGYYEDDRTLARAASAVSQELRSSITRHATTLAARGSRTLRRAAILALVPDTRAALATELDRHVASLGTVAAQALCDGVDVVADPGPVASQLGVAPELIARPLEQAASWLDRIETTYVGRPSILVADASVSRPLDPITALVGWSWGWAEAPAIGGRLVICPARLVDPLRALSPHTAAVAMLSPGEDGSTLTEALGRCEAGNVHEYSARKELTRWRETVGVWPRGEPLGWRDPTRDEVLR